MRGFKLFFVALILTVAVCTAIAKNTQVLYGVDVLQKIKFSGLEGSNVGLITNQTGYDREGVSTVDVFKKSDKVSLKCIMSPEHGFAGKVEHGENVQDGEDAQSKIPIYSLYGATTRPTADMLEDVDTIVFDIQDIGTRFYTYITTMAMAMEEAAKLKIKFVVLDRPNPIRGDAMDGDLLDPDIKRMTGYMRIPMRHGLTVGEIASWYRNQAQLDVNLTVIKMENWERKLWFDQTGLTFIPPSPNIPSPNAAFLYTGVGCFEATNLSVGRGTDKPFELFGAPWVNGKALANALKAADLPGLSFDNVKFVPTKDIYKGETCEGVRVNVNNRNKARPFMVFLHAFLFLNKTQDEAFAPDWEEVRVVTGSNALRETAEGKLSLEALVARYETAHAEFLTEISPYLLY